MVRLPKVLHLAAVLLPALGLTTTLAAQEVSAPTAEDELAPVRAIQERIDRALAEPVESLDLDVIMEGADFTGTRPVGIRWSADGATLWFEWKEWHEERTGTWELEVASGALRRLNDDEADAVPPRFALWDRDHRRAAWSVGDSVILRENGANRTLIEGLDGARVVGFSGDEEWAIVRYRDDLIALRLAATGDGPVLRRLTDIRAGSERDDSPDTASQGWLREQQLALFDVLARREARRAESRERQEAASPRPLYLGGWDVSSLVASPDLEWVAVFQRRDEPADRVAGMPDYVTTSGYTENVPTRVKVGDEQDAERLTLVHVRTGRSAVVDAGLEDREFGFQGGEWNDGSSRFLTQMRANDNKDRWFAVVTPATPGTEGEMVSPAPAGTADDTAEAASESEDPALTLETVVAFHDSDEAWINWAVAGGWGWLPDADAFFLVSERDGWLHLYRAAAAGGDPVQLTRGEFEVFSPRLHPDRDAFVFEASIVDPFEVHAYTLPLDGGSPEALTAGAGYQEVTLSPDATSLAIVASSSARPWELYVRATTDTGAGTRVTHSPSPAFGSYDWLEPEIVNVPASDGVGVPARLYRPANPHPDRPAVIFVHGAGYLHNVHGWWSSYSREYTFHHLLMERGYTVLDIDYRGSAGYGRDWRTAIYRHMGGTDLSDQVDGARYLVEEHGVDPGRIGIYGGSYGGFITLMALFTEPGVFGAGAALRPVTDWAHYNHPYTSNILNSPQDDGEAYWRSSPIYFAEGLEDPLLIAHGMVDGNVHFQGVVRLAQRLIELRKSDWEVALYPVEPHGFVEPSSWADEYRRILELFERELKGGR